MITNQKHVCVSTHAQKAGKNCAPRRGKASNIKRGELLYDALCAGSGNWLQPAHLVGRPRNKQRYSAKNVPKKLLVLGFELASFRYEAPCLTTRATKSY